MKLYYKLLFILLLLTGSANAASDFKDKGYGYYSSAGCLMKVNDKLLLVRDIWSGKLSLPGGMREKGEVLTQTAKREVKEETGLDFAVLSPIADDRKFLIFNCLAKNRIEILRYENIEKVKIVNPANDRSEISEAILLPISDIDRWNFKYPGQIEIIKGLYPSLPNNVAIETFSKNVNKLIITDIDKRIWARGKDIPNNANSILGFISCLGSLAFLILLSPYILKRKGYLFGPKVIIITLTAIVVSLFINDVFKILPAYEFCPDILRVSHDAFAGINVNVLFPIIVLIIFLGDAQGSLGKLSLLLLVIIVLLTPLVSGTSTVIELGATFIISLIFLFIYSKFKNSYTEKALYMGLCFTVFACIYNLRPENVVILLFLISYQIAHIILVRNKFILSQKPNYTAFNVSMMMLAIFVFDFMFTLAATYGHYYITYLRYLIEPVVIGLFVFLSPLYIEFVVEVKENKVVEGVDDHLLV
jgi:8-oxo-dGTP pyrophosphatase MutT (NUDIX family)